MKFNFKLKILDIPAFLLALSVAVWFSWYGLRSTGDLLQVRITGESREWIFPLEEDQILEIDGPSGVTVISVENGSIYIPESDCPDKLCVAMGSIDERGEWLACLPNRVFVIIEGTDTSGEQEVDDGAF